MSDHNAELNKALAGIESAAPGLDSALKELQAHTIAMEDDHQQHVEACKAYAAGRKVKFDHRLKLVDVYRPLLQASNGLKRDVEELRAKIKTGEE